MDLGERLALLAGAAKYDASCASSGAGRERDGFSGGKRAGTRLGAALPAGVCHSWTGDGRCISLLKVLFSNVCRFDCAYCANRASSDIRRASFSVGELVDLTCEFYRRNYIEGLFLSSGIFSDPDIVMEKLIETARKLRREAGFGGYIHLKLIPGAGEKTIREAGRWADRLSANIELPTGASLERLAPQKNGKTILGAFRLVHDAGEENGEDRLRARRTAPNKEPPVFAPAGQSTQLIVGASEEPDAQIIGLSDSLYRKFGMRRVYYSAFTPVAPAGKADPRLPDIAAPPLVREHRLYQADWLLRFYHFRADEILEGASSLDATLDPKTAWALRHPDFFPVEIQRASYEELLRVPGLGATSARRIVETRRSRALSFDTLGRSGVVLKRAKYFLTAGGRALAEIGDPARLRRVLSVSGAEALQLPLFDF